MNMNDFRGGALGVCMCSLQVARECGELLPAKTTWGRVVGVLHAQFGKDSSVRAFCTVGGRPERV